MKLAATEIGQGIAAGLIDSICQWLFVLLIIALLWALVRNCTGAGTDDSDKDAWHRSGLRILTDHKTGVQYVTDGKGGMFVRMDATGKPMISRD